MPGSPRFEAIVFDVGGILVHHENHLVYEALAARCRRGVSVRDVAARVADPRVDVGARPVAELRDELVRDLGYAGDDTQFQADWCCHFTLDTSMIAYAHALAAKLHVLLFSNTNREHWEFLVADPTNGLGSFERYLSWELGLAKPAVGAYAHVAREAGIEPSRALFLDDRLENVEGAREAGFHAEVFGGEVWLTAYLMNAGVPVP